MNAIINLAVVFAANLDTIACLHVNFHITVSCMISNFSSIHIDQVCPWLSARQPSNISETELQNSSSIQLITKLSV